MSSKFNKIQFQVFGNMSTSFAPRQLSKSSSIIFYIPITTETFDFAEIRNYIFDYLGLTI